MARQVQRPSAAAARWTLALAALAALAAHALAAPQDNRRGGCGYSCPLCDASVFGYCSEKLLHDYCCCHSRYDPDPLPYQCRYADCSFLHANSCKEHKLISCCCCNQIFYQYRSPLRALT